MNKKKKKKTVRRDLTFVNRVMSLIVIIAEGLTLLAISGLTRFSSLSRSLFMNVNIGVLAGVLLINFLVILAIGRRSIRLVKFVLITSLIMAAFSGGLVYVEYRLNVNLNRMIDDGQSRETVGIAFVVYDGGRGSSIQSEQNLNGKVFGILDDETSEQGSIMPKKEIDKLKINVEYRGYSDYTRCLEALVAGEIDAAALPSNYKGMFDASEQFDETLGQLRTLHNFDRQLTINTEPGSDKDVTKEPFTVLMIGTDENRSDAIMLAAINPVSLNVMLTSIPRDSYVPIACYTNKASDKINAARTRGRQCLIDTVESVMGIDVDFYFESNFKGIVEIVNALGGVIIDSPKEFVGQDASDERGHQTVWIPKGVNRLNGEQALAFARERYQFESGDFQRQSNQQQVIKAMLTEAVRLRDVNKALKVLDAAGENVSTNLSVDQMISLFNLTMKKMERSYVGNQNVVNLIGSRVTGVPGRHRGASIVRIYEGSVKDNQKMLQRQLDLKSSIDAPKAIQFSINWIYSAPVISPDYYNEKFPEEKEPDVVPNFIGRSLSAVNKWAKTRGIEVTVKEVVKGDSLYDKDNENNTVVKQSVKSGTDAEGLKAITVHVQIGEEAKIECPDNSVYSEKKAACICKDGYSAAKDSDLKEGGKGCQIKAEATPKPTAKPTPTPEATQKPCGENEEPDGNLGCRPKPTPESTPEPTQKPCGENEEPDDNLGCKPIEIKPSADSETDQVIPAE